MPSGSLSPSAILSSSPAAGSHEPDLDLRTLPNVYVIPAHLPSEELHHVEDTLIRCGAPLTYDATEAKLFLGKLSTKKRAQFELRSLHIQTEEVIESVKSEAPLNVATEDRPPRKRTRKAEPATASKKTSQAVSLNGSTTQSETEEEIFAQEDLVAESITTRSKAKAKAQEATSTGSEWSTESDGPVVTPPRLLKRQRTPEIDTVQDRIRRLILSDNILVLKVQWLEDSVNCGRPLPINGYLVYEGSPERGQSRAASTSLISPRDVAKSSPDIKSPSRVAEQEPAESILERARADTPPRGQGPVSRFASAPHGARRFMHQGHRSRWGELKAKTRPLLQPETSSQEIDGDGDSIPPPPDWVRQKLRFSCQRITLANPPNEDFIELLKKIRLARLLTGDEIGVRAYSTSIAAIAACPTRFISPREILRLPGCDAKIVNLWIEMRNTGVIEAAEEVTKDETLQVLKRFYDIWGVGATTAREFYFDRGWTTIDDIVDYGWNTLSRAQQVGVKYYEEFQVGIPRDEVEFIMSKVREHAVKVRDEGIETILVGGYRRGKIESGDVDIIVSHRQLEKTAGLVEDIVASLEEEKWITHTLLITETNTRRGQSTLPFRSVGVASHGAGFDTLDKALVVWRDINWPTKAEGDSQDDNPNVHRRVDIIVSPWRTVGCAVAGWTSGTTFQRDLRRYAKHAHGWKFDSSGIRNRHTGEVIRLEGPDGVTGSMVDAEKAVFQGMGLVYREPHERCTD